MNPDRHALAAICERYGVELRIDGGRLFARWTSEGLMPEGAAMFIRRFRDDLVQALEEREEVHADPGRRNRDVEEAA